jgi:hypothetical protein
LFRLYYHVIMLAPERQYLGKETAQSVWQWVTCWTVGVLFPTGTRHISGPSQRPSNHPIQWVPGALSQRIKRPGRKSDDSSTSFSKFKNIGTVPPLSIRVYFAVFLRTEESGRSSRPFMSNILPVSWGQKSMGNKKQQTWSACISVDSNFRILTLFRFRFPHGCYLFTERFKTYRRERNFTKTTTSQNVPVSWNVIAFRISLYRLVQHIGRSLIGTWQYLNGWVASTMTLSTREGVDGLWVRGVAFSSVSLPHRVVPQIPHSHWDAICLTTGR